jgi:DNA-binding transcriptional LysR family regulator
MDSLSRIGIFLAVAKQESFAAAARDLGLTSSAVSKQVLNLEGELHTKLLNRTTRKVSLTEEGALFFSRASRAMEDIAEAREQMNELKTTPRGQLRISVPTALGTQYLKGPIAEFALKYPEVTLDVQFEDRLIDIAEEGFRHRGGGFLSGAAHCCAERLLDDRAQTGIVPLLPVLQPGIPATPQAAAYCRGSCAAQRAGLHTQQGCA